MGTEENDATGLSQDVQISGRKIQFLEYHQKSF